MITLKSVVNMQMEIFECASSKKLFLNVHIVLGISSSLVTGELNENFPT